MFRILQKLAENMARPRVTPAIGRGHLAIRDPNALVYAIGDVHGCLDQLVALEQIIEADARDHAGPVYVVMVGDYVDRGPDSAGVLDHLIRPPSGRFQRICLAGNHDAMMLAFLKNPAANANWLKMGGEETLVSYGVLVPRNQSRREWKALKSDMDHNIPSDHRRFLERLPLTVSVGRHVIVHAGLRPGIPLESQSAVDLLWIRDDFLQAEPGSFSQIVIHGHTPVAEPGFAGDRISVDTAAYTSGRLSAARVLRDRVTFLSSDQPVARVIAAIPAELPTARIARPVEAPIAVQVPVHSEPAPVEPLPAAVKIPSSVPLEVVAAAPLQMESPLPPARTLPVIEVPEVRPIVVAAEVAAPVARPQVVVPVKDAPPVPLAAVEDATAEIDLAALAGPAPAEVHPEPEPRQAREPALAALRPLEIDVVPAAVASQDLDSTVQITEEMIEQRIHALLNALNATKRARRAAKAVETPPAPPPPAVVAPPAVLAKSLPPDRPRRKARKKAAASAMRGE